MQNGRNILGWYAWTLLSFPPNLCDLAVHELLARRRTSCSGIGQMRNSSAFFGGLCGLDWNDECREISKLIARSCNNTEGNTMEVDLIGGYQQENGILLIWASHDCLWSHQTANVQRTNLFDSRDLPAFMSMPKDDESSMFAPINYSAKVFTIWREWEVNFELPLGQREMNDNQPQLHFMCVRLQHRYFIYWISWRCEIPSYLKKYRIPKAQHKYI